jgi:hypothetical protein
MGTNTSGHIMVADGTNFNPVAVSGDVTIAANGAVTIANGAVETAMVNANVITGQTAETSLDSSNDTILIHDASASALRKTTLASISSALGGITDVVADTSPQLGGNLDTNSHNILIDNAHFIADESGNEQIIFNTTGSAINQFEITNAAAHGGAFVKGPHLSVSGGDTNLDLNLAAKGTGKVVIKGNDEQGGIQFNCESNSHGQILRAAPHSASADNVLILPQGTNDGSAQELVAVDITQTLTNKTLTSPVLGGTTTTASGNLLLNPATQIVEVRGSGSTEGQIQLNCRVNTHGQKIIAQPHSEGVSNEMLLPKDGNSTLVSEIATQTLTNKTLTSPKINEDVALTATATELNLLDGVSGLVQADFTKLAAVDSTSTELNLVDGSSAGTIVNSKAVIYGSSGEVNATTLQIAGTSITSTATELNLLDGGTSVGSSITVADSDGIIINDGGTMKSIPASAIKTYAAGDSASKGFATAMAIAL